MTTLSRSNGQMPPTFSIDLGGGVVQLESAEEGVEVSARVRSATGDSPPARHIVNWVRASDREPARLGSLAKFLIMDLYELSRSHPLVHRAIGSNVELEDRLDIEVSRFTDGAERGRTMTLSLGGFDVLSYSDEELGEIMVGMIRSVI